MLYIVFANMRDDKTSLFENSNVKMEGVENSDRDLGILPVDKLISASNSQPSATYSASSHAAESLPSRHRGQVKTDKMEWCFGMRDGKGSEYEEVLLAEVDKANTDELQCFMGYSDESVIVQPQEVVSSAPLCSTSGIESESIENCLDPCFPLFIESKIGVVKKSQTMSSDVKYGGDAQYKAVVECMGQSEVSEKTEIWSIKTDNLWYHYPQKKVSPMMVTPGTGRKMTKLRAKQLFFNPDYSNVPCKPCIQGFVQDVENEVESEKQFMVVLMLYNPDKSNKPCRGRPRLNRMKESICHRSLS